MKVNHHQQKRRLAGVATLLAAAALAPGAQAATKDHTFAGTCKSTHGTLEFANGVTTKAADNSFTFAARGGCAGLVDGADAGARDSELKLAGSGSVGCFGSPDIPVTGTFTVGGVTIPVTGFFKISTPQISYTVHGTDGGTGNGSGSVITTDQNYGAMGGCVVGPAVKMATTTTDFATDSPLAAPIGAAVPAVPAHAKAVRRSRKRPAHHPVRHRRPTQRHRRTR